MGRMSRSSPAVVATVMVAATVVWGAGLAMGDFSSDQAECAESLLGLSTCLTYVEKSAKSPTPDCCAGLKQVIEKKPKCLCILIRDRDDPQLGFKIDANRAMSLPSVCNVPANISHCPGLLKLDPNSKDAEIFKQFGGGSKQGNATSSNASGIPANSSTEKAKDMTSGAAGAGCQHYRLGCRRRTWLGLQVPVVGGGLWTLSCALALYLSMMGS